MSKSVDIPRKSRLAVHERDGGLCRVCGRWAEPAALHHIVLRSRERNYHDPSNLVTVGFTPGHLCHQMVHAHNATFQPALEAVVDAPGVTALQWLRWQGVDIRGLFKGSL